MTVELWCCEDCEWFCDSGVALRGSETLGDCHRYPPVAIAQPDEQGDVESPWPVVSSGSYCGEFRIGHESPAVLIRSKAGRGD